jgi:acyl transferase domain-containing protein
VEISPQSVLSQVLNDMSRKLSKDNLVVRTMTRNVSALDSMLDLCGTLYLNGYVPRWFGDAASPHGALPSYPWQRESYWLDPVESKPRKMGKTHPLLGQRVMLARAAESAVWETDISARLPAYLAEHRLFGRAVFPAAGYVEMALLYEIPREFGIPPEYRYAVVVSRRSGAFVPD